MLLWLFFFLPICWAVSVVYTGTQLVDIKEILIRGTKLFLKMTAATLGLTAAVTLLSVLL